MSTTIISIEEVLSVEPHPDADRLDLIKVLGYQVVTGKGNFKVGDHVVYFPPDMMIPTHQSEPLGVTQYLKHARMSLDTCKVQCRVAAARLRGIPSYGFCAPLSAWCGETRKTYAVGADVTSHFEGEKYIPPERLGGGDQAPDMPNFHRYTSIENIQRYPNLIDLGVDVPPARFVEAVKDSGAGVLALSGLLTLAFDAMKHTVEAIDAEGLRSKVKIIVGGGCVDDEIRKYAGADAYGGDAQNAVTLTRNWLCSDTVEVVAG
jgi:hypothetical protein